MRVTRRCVLWALVGVVGVGALAVLAGAIPIRASVGHWPPTRWLLQLAKGRAVATQSLAVEAPPPLDDPARVLRGAGHYQGGCRPCHGAPGIEPSRITEEMTPTPPLLAVHRIDERSDRELFFVVKHGIKFTGMPAWVARERDDEVWDVVAFLRRLPDLDEAGYAGLVWGPPRDAVEPAAGDAGTEEAAPGIVREICARCHGLDGTGRAGDAFPHLAGQRAAYLQHSLAAYTSGARASGIMQPIAVAIEASERAAAVAWYASRARPSEPTLGPADTLRVLGRALAEQGDAARRIAACDACHGSDAPTPGVYPRLSGQPADYLERQLELFARGVRGGSIWSAIMREVAKPLTPADRAALAAWYGRDGATPPE
ncbi:MAG: c-type cytochrome [Gemmatimonadota bacterium]